MTRAPGDAGRRDVTGASVLVVDDEADNLRLLTSILGERGLDVRPVKSGAQALVAAELAPPDLMLLDLRMPDMDGWEVCARFKASERLCAVPIIFVSGRSDVEHKVRAFEVGAVDYVTKPFNVAEVVARVETHLALERRTRELAESHERLKELEDVRNELVHMVAHDVRSPLVGIAALLESLRTKPGIVTSPTDAEDLEEALSSLRRVWDLVTNAVELRRLELARMPVTVAPSALAPIVEQAIRDLGPLRRRRIIEVSAPEPLVAVCDPIVTARIVSNLVVNAIKYAPADAPIRVELAAEPGRSLVRVHDAGPGRRNNTCCSCRSARSRRPAGRLRASGSRSASSPRRRRGAASASTASPVAAARSGSSCPSRRDERRAGRAVAGSRRGCRARGDVPLRARCVVR